MNRPIFSGHETFRCKTHWLKRGYDFIGDDGNFNAEDAVVRLILKISRLSQLYQFVSESVFRYLLNSFTSRLCLDMMILAFPCMSGVNCSSFR